MLLLLKYPVPCLDWKIYIYIFFYHYFSSWKMHGVQYFSAGFMRYIKYSVFSCRCTPWITNDPTSTDSEKKSFNLCDHCAIWRAPLRFVKIVGKNLYRNKLKLTTIFDKPVTRTPCALLPVLQKIHLTIVNLSRKEKNAKISFENYKASKIWKKKKEEKNISKTKLRKKSIVELRGPIWKSSSSQKRVFIH